MANRRTLKKDIDWLTSEVVEDCFVYLTFKNKDEEKIVDIVNKILDERNNAFAKISEKTSSLEKKEVKAKFNNIVKEFIEVADACLEDLSKLTKK